MAHNYASFSQLRHEGAFQGDEAKRLSGRWRMHSMIML